ncbi:glycosyltransferase [Limimaricola cinnabarinus]|uniref:glycosyltransferase n=1 Tax=Limimaricola cinnabarinus TaxID=1125964 RepID=UPI003D7E20E7
MNIQCKKDPETYQIGDESSQTLIFVTPRPVWPIKGGDCIRAHQIVSALTEKSAKILLCTLTGTQRPEAVPNNIRDKVDVYNFRRGWKDVAVSFSMVARGAPLQMLAFHNEGVRTFVKSRMKASEGRLFCHTIRAASAIPKGINRRRVILDFCDSLSMTYQRLYSDRDHKWMKRAIYSYEGSRVRSYEQKCRSLASNCIAISKLDAKALGDPNMWIIENWVDSPVHSRSVRSRDVENKYPLRGVMIANFRTTQNSDAARLLHIWSDRLRKSGRIEIDLWGQNSEAMSSLEDKGFRVRGTFSDLSGPLKNVDVAFCLTRISGGLQNKVIQAAAYGIPTMLTPNVAASSPLLIERETCFVVRSQAEMEDQILNTDRQAFRDIGISASEMVNRELSQEEIRKKWHRCLGNCLPERLYP